MIVRRLRDATRRRRGVTYFRPAGEPTKDRTILFVRNVTGFTGGHLKVHDYFDHVRASDPFTPCIRFGASTVWDDANPWAADDLEQFVLDSRPAAVFVGGATWRLIPEELAEVPVLNLVQHVRHADPSDTRSAFLERRAVRICVSPEVAAAIEATGRVNGPVITIPNGIDVAGIRRTRDLVPKDVELLVLANKQPDLGREVADAAGGAAVDLVDDTIERNELLDRMAHARVAVVLPNPTEGFYLPALEAMALGAIVVCPDCVGNRSFCIDGETAFRPDHDAAAIVAATRRALAMPDTSAMTSAGIRMAEAHDLSLERARFLDVLGHIDEL